MQDILQTIRDLQHSDKSGAESLLLSFLNRATPYEVESVDIRPLAVSLNSFNGVMTLKNGQQYFFKTHTETDTVISEYYNAELLAHAGYPVIQPVFKSAVPGQQLLVYELIKDDSVFDLAWRIESGDTQQLEALSAAQNAADDALLDIYLSTLAWSDSASVAKAPIHQLFYHRLMGGRLTRFYGIDLHKPDHIASTVTIELPGATKTISDLLKVKWVINGQVYSDSLVDILVRASRLLAPYQYHPTVIGHGDAHNGNVFFRSSASQPKLVYFDPAFAGRHHPLLDITKPLFHNVFAMWMYFPEHKNNSSSISLNIQHDHWIVDYSYDIPSIREMFLESKLERVLVPTLIKLKQANMLQPDWKIFLKSALFCCPMLTMNLADNSRFQPEISLLGFAMAMEMGAPSTEKRSLIDEKLDYVEELVAQA